jgi:hypothetical protein
MGINGNGSVTGPGCQGIHAQVAEHEREIALLRDDYAELARRFEDSAELREAFDQLRSLVEMGADNARSARREAEGARAAVALLSNEVMEHGKAIGALQVTVGNQHGELVSMLGQALKDSTNSARTAQQSMAEIVVSDRAGERDLRKERAKVWARVVSAVALAALSAASAYYGARQQSHPAPISAPATK